VFKPNNLFGSRGLVVGHLTSEPDWRAALDTAVGSGDHIVQQLVRPDSWASAYWHIDSETLVNVEAPVLVGPFCVDGTDGGWHTQQPIKGTEDDLLNRSHDMSLGCVMSA
jgi:hypothetical protein